LLPYHLSDSASAIAASFEQSSSGGGGGGDGSPPQNGHVTIATTSFAHASQTRALQHGSSSASSRNGSWQTPHAGGGIVAPGGGVVVGGGPLTISQLSHFGFSGFGLSVATLLNANCSHLYRTPYTVVQMRLLRNPH
jgi:hypothetical protein